MQKEDPLVSIIILNFDTGDLLLKCVESIEKCNYSNYEIILVDNASTDNSHKLCKEKFQKIKLIENKENLGYCRGNNIGISEAKGKFLVVLNPDIVVDKNWLKELIQAYDKSGDGLYQPKLLVFGNESKINSAGNMIQTFGFGYSRGKGENDDEQYNNTKQIGFASGACLFTTKELMEEIGNFEPFLFAYNEDMDLGWRASKMGINSYYIPSAIVKHAESYSYKWIPKKFYLLERNRHYCILTHYSHKTILKILPSLIVIELFVLFYFLSKGMLKEKFRAYGSIIKKSRFISKKHAESEMKRKISDKELIKNFVDEIFVPKDVSGELNNKNFNRVLSFLSKSFRHFV